MQDYTVFYDAQSNFTVNFSGLSYPRHKACWEIWPLVKVPSSIQRAPVEIYSWAENEV